MLQPSQSVAVESGANSVSPPVPTTVWSATSWRSTTVIVVGLMVVNWIVFGQTTRHGFINFDDPSYVSDNPHVPGGLTWENVTWAFTHVHSCNWHPLTWMSHMLDCQVFGLNPAGHHLTNVLLHVVATLLLFAVLRSTTGYPWRSAFVAAVFAVHPLHVESVAWVAERKDVLSGVFFMLTIGAYAHYARRSWSFARYTFVLLAFALGLMSKPMLVTLPVLLLLLDYWPLRRLPDWTDSRAVARCVVDKLPLLALSAASGTATLFAQTEAMQSLQQISVASRLGNAVVSYAIYLVQMVWPYHLAIPYPFHRGDATLWPVVLASVLLVGLSGAAVGLRRRYPYLLVGWLWYLVMLVPVIGIVQVGMQAHADRYTYLPQIGLYIAVSWAAADFVAERWRASWVFPGLATVAVIALIFSASTQAAYWRDSETLWTHSLACTTDNDVAHCNLGDVFAEEGKLDDAIDHFRHAVAIDPNYVNAHNNLGNALLLKGNVEEAVTHFRKAADLQPGFAVAYYNLGNALFRGGSLDDAIIAFERALQLSPTFAEALNNLGAVLLRKGNVDAAIMRLQQALQCKPDYVNAHNLLCGALLQTGRLDDAIARCRQFGAVRPETAMSYGNIGNALLEKGRTNEAIAYLSQALEGMPNAPLVHSNLGNALLQKGRANEALEHFRRALELRPDDPDIQNNLAWMLATSPYPAVRDGKTAAQLAERANRLTGGENPNMLDTLAAAYAEAGQFREAVANAQHALQLAQAHGEQVLVAQLDAKLRLYAAGKPFREQAR